MTETTRYRTPGFGASAVLAVLHTPFGRGLAPNLGELRYQARRSRRNIALPVSCVRSGDIAIVRVARSETKQWWRNFRSSRSVSVRLEGHWIHGIGHVASAGTLEHEQIAAVYQRSHPRTEIPATDPFVVIDLATDRRRHDSEEGTRRLESGIWRRWFTAVT